MLTITDSNRVGIQPNFFGITDLVGVGNNRMNYTIDGFQVVQHSFC